MVMTNSFTTKREIFAQTVAKQLPMYNFVQVVIQRSAELLVGFDFFMNSLYPNNLGYTQPHKVETPSK